MPNATAPCPTWCTVPAEHHDEEQARTGERLHARTVWTGEQYGRVEAIRGTDSTHGDDDLPSVSIEIPQLFAAPDDARQIAAAIIRAADLAAGIQQLSLTGLSSQWRADPQDGDDR